MSTRSTLLLEYHLKELKLPTFLREYHKLATQCAAEGADHPDYLLRLAELELIDRHQRMVQRRIRAAHFPATKSLDTFDFLTIPSVYKALVMQLARCEYIERRENVIAIAIGNSGTGQTHVALGLGLAACQRGMSVGFTTAAALVHELMEASSSRLTRSSWRTWPHRKLRRNVPRVDGALTTQPMAPAVPPVRSTSASSMQSPPASADATRVSIWSPAFARPGAAPRSTWLSTSSRRPKCWARVTGRSSPALATRRWSSKAI